MSASSPITSPMILPDLSDFIDGEWSFPSSPSDEDGVFDSPPTTPRSSLVEEALTRYEQLYSLERDDLLLDDLFQRQQLFSNTISDLASQACLKKAMRTIEDAEAKQVWQGYPKERAKVYLHVIEQILEKGVHHNAVDLYSRALEGKVWEGGAEQQQAAIQALKSVGYKL